MCIRDRRYVDICNRFGRDDNSPHRSRRFVDRVEHALMEELSVGEEERCGPTKQNQARNAARIRIPLSVMVAANTLDPAEHCVIWPPAVPKKFNKRDYNCDSNSGNNSEFSNACKANDGKPEFPLLLMVDATQIGEFEQADRRSDHYRSECAARHILEQIR